MPSTTISRPQANVNVSLEVSKLTPRSLIVSVEITSGTESSTPKLWTRASIRSPTGTTSPGPVAPSSSHPSLPAGRVAVSRTSI